MVFEDEGYSQICKEGINLLTGNVLYIVKSYGKYANCEEELNFILSLTG